MIDFIKKYFSPGQESSTEAPSAQHDIRIATCALFLEMANIDGEFSDVEREHVLEFMKGHYDLSDEHAADLAELAREELAGSIDLWRFTNLVNQNYSRHEKIQIVELIWRLIYADGHLSKHENYLVRKLGKMLRLTHSELIDAKLAVLHEQQGEKDE